MARQRLNDKVICRQRGRIDEFGAVDVDLRSCPRPPRSATTRITVVERRRRRPAAPSKCRSTAGPSSRSSSRRPTRFVVQGSEVVATVQARYYFGQPVANGQRALRRRPAAYYSPLAGATTPTDEERLLLRRRPDAAEGDAAARRRAAAARCACRWPKTTTAATTAPASKRGSPMPAAARSAAPHLVHATYGSFLVATRPRSVRRPARRHASTLSARALDYTGAAAARRAGRASLLERLDYADGYYNEPTVTRSRASTHATHRCRRAGLGADHAAPATTGQLPRRRDVAREGQRDLRDDAWLWVPGASDTPADDRQRRISSCWPTSAATPRATPRGSWSAAATSSGRCW